MTAKEYGDAADGASSSDDDDDGTDGASARSFGGDEHDDEKGVAMCEIDVDVAAPGATKRERPAAANGAPPPTAAALVASLDALDLRYFER